LVLAIALGEASAAHAQISITLSGTATNNTLGYTIGQPVTFTYTIASSFGNYTPSYFDASYNNWYEYHVPADSLFTAVTGTGLTGTYTRPTFDDTDPHSFLQLRKNVDGSGYDFMQMSAGSQHGDMGLSVGGELVQSIYMQLSRTGANFAFAATWVEPTTVLSAAMGTYDPTLGTTYGLTITRTIGGNANFEITSMTISAVPEPSAYAMFAGVSALGLAMYRRRKLAA
jgi:hypothetical protein